MRVGGNEAIKRRKVQQHQRRSEGKISTTAFKKRKGQHGVFAKRRPPFEGRGGNNSHGIV